MKYQLQERRKFHSEPNQGIQAWIFSSSEHFFITTTRTISKSFIMSPYKNCQLAMGPSVRDVFFGGMVASHFDWSQADFTIETVASGRWYTDFQVSLSNTTVLFEVYSQNTSREIKS
jgi:hypothetical protein